MIAAAAAAALAAAAAVALTSAWPGGWVAGWVGRLARHPLLGFAALVGLGAVAVLLAALPGLAGARPPGLFVLWVVGVLVLLGIGAAGAWQVRDGSGSPDR